MKKPKKIPIKPTKPLPKKAKNKTNNFEAPFLVEICYNRITNN